MARAHKNLISMINCADFSSHARESFQDLAPFSLFEGAASKEDFSSLLNFFMNFGSSLQVCLLVVHHIFCITVKNLVYSHFLC